MSKPLFENLLEEVTLKIKENPNELVMDIIFQVVNFINKVPNTNAFLLEDSTLAYECININYPDDLTVENIVITNIQERLHAMQQ